jgi:hypothetical protein
MLHNSQSLLLMVASMSAVPTPGAGAIDVVADVSGVMLFFNHAARATSLFHATEACLHRYQATWGYLKFRLRSLQNITIQNSGVVVSACPPGAWCSSTPPF